MASFPPVPPPPPRRDSRGGPWLLWAVIVGLAAAWMSLKQPDEPPSADAAGPPKASVVSMQTELVGEITYAFLPAKGEELSGDMILMNARPLAESPAWLDRVAWAVLVAAVKDPEAGAAALERAEVPADSPTPESDAALLAAVRERLPGLADPAGEPAAEADLSRLGWYGKLLEREVAPRPGVVVALIAYGGWFLGCFLVGFALVVTLAVLAAMGRLRARLEPPVPAGRIYGETFAVWMAAFLGLNVLGALLAGLALGEEPAANAEEVAALAVGGGSFLLSLGALAWPAFRGVRAADLRSDLGLHFGAGFFRETLAGAFTYCLALPLLALGLVAYFVLVAIFGQAEQPSHPVVEMIGEASWLKLLGLFALASIVAPLVEEIAFRGILYRHLRDECGRLGLVASLVVAALASSFLFAVIHPQGVLFAPALTGLAVAFCISRETRGSLWPAMVAHGINNAVTLSLGVMLLGG
jgi:membrane protease YdiL (CAAX protease family)